jgi:predicted amidohydrolase YtcJ
VGAEKQVLEAAGASADVEDLGRRTVLPGFIDAHHHFSGALAQQAAVDCGPGATRDIGGILERLRSRAGEGSGEAWLEGRGYDELALAEGRHPTRAEVDSICPDRPVLLSHYSCHEGVANTRALQLAGYERGTPDPPAGVIERGADGEPTGRVIETAYSRLAMLAETDQLNREADAFLDRIEPYENSLFSKGITRVCDPAVTPAMGAMYRLAAEKDRIRMPMGMLWASGDGHFWPPRDRLSHDPTGAGPEHLRVGHLKFFFDGGNRCAMRMSLWQFLGTAGKTIAGAVKARSLAGLRTGSDMQLRLGRDACVRTGILFYDPGDAQGLIRIACERGFAISIHAIGNDAVDMALDALERVRDLHPESPPPQIVHACVISSEQASRAAALGLVVVAQPIFLKLPIFGTMSPPPGLRFIALRTLLDAGVRVAGSSDAPVTDCDPLDAVRAAVTRESGKGKTVHAEEAIDACQAVAMYTREAAHSMGCAGITGTLQPGMRADLVVLTGDPCESIQGVKVARTILNGETVFQADQ